VETDPQPHGPHLCEHRPLSETSGPSSPECTDPNVATVAEATPHERGVLRARLLRPQGSRDVVAHFFDPASDAVYVGPSRERTANAAQYVASKVHSCDRRKGLGGHVGSAGRPGSPQRSGIAHGDSSRAEYARRKVESSFWSGAGSQPSCAAGTAVVRRTYPEELRRLLVLRVINSFTAPVLL